ncbi:DC1, C1-like protein [Artemisia annua]|uniref:DC1, C1-like protein n=1 Tax=Artemisia annua TaxID=35608 RepID=A0A2U1Q1K7_ARTAN|nr:DC1, C1-like protein [Artemisia annua]
MAIGQSIFKIDCVFLRKKLVIQHFRKDNFIHTHPLTLAYSFPKDDQKAKFYPRCKVCEGRFDENLWIYKCEKCRFYVHVDCATTSKKASYNALQLNPGTSAASKNYKDSDYPDLLHLPFPDQTAAIKHFYGESGSRAFETNLTHTTTSPTSSRITTSSSHDSMKMVEVLCNACIRPITNMPFYKCTTSDDGCNFVLHVSCTRLPTEVKRTDDNNDIRTLKLLPPVPFASTIDLVENYGGDYFCEVCEEEFNPNAAFYHCDQCVQSIHLPCVGFIFQEATTWTPFLLDRCDPGVIRKITAEFHNHITNAVD